MSPDHSDMSPDHLIRCCVCGEVAVSQELRQRTLPGSPDLCPAHFTRWQDSLREQKLGHYYRLADILAERRGGPKALSDAERWCGWGI
jgi:hypothetical protein